MEYGPDHRGEKVGEFDLILERPGKWTLKATTIPSAGYWFGRQRDAMSMANEHLSRDCTTTTVRLKNHLEEVNSFMIP